MYVPQNHHCSGKKDSHRDQKVYTPNLTPRLRQVRFVVGADTRKKRFAVLGELDWWRAGHQAGVSDGFRNQSFQVLRIR
jgi:hypothetical protein